MKFNIVKKTNNELLQNCVVHSHVHARTERLYSDLMAVYLNARARTQRHYVDLMAVRLNYKGTYEGLALLKRNLVPLINENF